MRRLLILYVALAMHLSYGQNQLGIYTGLTHGVSLYIKDFNTYSESDFQLGIESDTHNGKLFAYGIYRFGGCLFLAKNDLSSYALNYSALGIGVGHRFLESMRASPFVRLDFLTEIKQRNKISPIYMDEYMSPNTQIYSDYPKYSSTFFIGNISAGADFKVVKNFRVYVGTGFSIRGIETFYPPKILMLNSRRQVNVLYGINFQLGFNYTFFLNKNKQQTDALKSIDK